MIGLRVFNLGWELRWLLVSMLQCPSDNYKYFLGYGFVSIFGGTYGGIEFSRC